MTALNESANYVWDTTQVLGKGATSIVFSGRHKRSGEQIAVKVFSASSYHRPLEVQFREYEVMRKLNNENVVKLLAVEEEEINHQKVLIMELCEFGSLHTFLDNPENGYGVAEETFVLILKHVANGMKHLRDNGIVHRDVKPGNILCSKSEDGSWVYKLTDFGAARELEDEESFMSLYGTEEYLHPDIYERAVLRRCPGKQFASTVDLWSLGVTFYHIATGNLPFRPYGGRRNRETMHMITAQKEPGVISGVQRTEGGKIEWSRKLPETCQLSMGLKNMLTPFLASLLERQQQRTGPFEKFFSEAENITKKTVVDIFFPQTGSSLKIYIDPADNLTQLQDLIAVQTEIPAKDQLLIYHGEHLNQIVGPLDPISSYPQRISQDNPLFVFNISDDNCCHPHVTSCNFPNCQSSIFLDVDYTTTKKCCILLYSLLRKVEKLHLQAELMHQAVENFRKLVRMNSNSNMKFQSLSQFCVTSLKWRETLIHIKNQQSRCLLLLLHKNGNEHKQIKTFLHNIKEKLDPFIEKCQTASVKVFSENHRMSERFKEVTAKQDLAWNKNVGSLSEEKLVQRCQVIVEQAMLIFVSFKEDRNKKELSYNEKQIHEFEKNKITELCAKASSLLELGITKSKAQITEYSHWYRKALQRLNSVFQLQEAYKSLSEQQKDFVEKLNSFSEYYLCLSDESIRALEDDMGTEYGSLTQYDNVPNQVKPVSNIDSSSAESGSRQEKLTTIIDELKTSRASLEEVMSLMHENTSLINSFNKFPESPTDMNWEPFI